MNALEGMRDAEHVEVDCRRGESVCGEIKRQVSSTPDNQS
jgi:tryptophanyl-tRNA synthetase